MSSNVKLIKIVSMSTLFVLTLTFVFVAATITANAEDGSNTQQTQQSANTTTQEQKEKREKLEAELKAKREKLEAEKKQRETEYKAKVEARKTEVSTRLADTKLENCKKREAAINKGLKNVADRRSKQLEVFNKISERTQKFYTDKDLSLANYDVLVADVNAKKSAAESAIADLKTKTIDFKCDGTDPVGAVDAYKAAREEVVVALKEYKTAIKNLIVAVKSVASKPEGSED